MDQQTLQRMWLRIRPCQYRKQYQTHAQVIENGSADEGADRDAELDQKSLDPASAQVTAKKEDAPARNSDAAGAAGKPRGSQIQERFEARAKSSAGSGPLLQNHVQTHNNPQVQQEDQASTTRQAQGLADSANKPGAAERLGSTSPAVTVHGAGEMPPASPAPAAAPAQSMQEEVSGEGQDAQRLAKDKSAVAALSFPSEFRSEATAGMTVISIDKSGAVFRSEDAGKNWQLVHVQWSGRAVQVKLKSPAPADAGLLKEVSHVFELTTDKLETWISRDGKTWSLQLPTSK